MDLVAKKKGGEKKEKENKNLLNPSQLVSSSRVVVFGRHSRNTVRTSCSLRCFLFFFTSTPSPDPSSNFVRPLTLPFTLPPRPPATPHLPRVLCTSSSLPLVLTLPHHSPPHFQLHFLLSFRSPPPPCSPSPSPVPPPAPLLLCPWLLAVTCAC